MTKSQPGCEERGLGGGELTVEFNHLIILNPLFITNTIFGQLRDMYHSFPLVISIQVIFLHAQPFGGIIRKQSWVYVVCPQRTDDLVYRGNSLTNDPLDHNVKCTRRKSSRVELGNTAENKGIGAISYKYVSSPGPKGLDAKGMDKKT